MEDIGDANEVAHDATVKILATEANATGRVKATTDEETISQEANVGVVQENAEVIPPANQERPSVPGRFISADQWREIRTCFRELLHEEVEGVVENTINETVNTRCSLLREMKEQRDFAMSKITNLKDEFKRTVNEKIAQISELQVFFIECHRKTPEGR